MIQQHSMWSMKQSSITQFLILTLASIPAVVQSLRCYQCNTAVDYNCGWINVSRVEPDKCDANVNACGLYVQQGVWPGSNEPGMQIIRSCSSYQILVPDSLRHLVPRIELSRDNSFAGLTSVHTICFTDGCNHGGRRSGLHRLVLIVSLTVVLFW